ncbi:hypothetical protein [Streptomyces sp. NPDC047000]|uniref:hypothetical protein n=1 Tax=Streptomyces sp. NPDC047000 TaxID=3155474 RepID=UPI0033D4EBE8
MLAAAALAGAAVPLLGTGAAQASTSGGCESATVQYRIVDADGKVVGADWTSQGGFHQWDTAPATVEVRLAAGQSVGDGCTYPVSLAQYTTEGPDWASSGHQTLVTKDTVRLTAKDVAGPDAGDSWQKLSVRTPDCYGQIDLYGDDVTYDGGSGEGHGPAPYRPDNVNTPYHLIAAWNGGDKACTTGGSTPTAGESAPATPATPTAPAGSTTPAAGTTAPGTTAKPKPTSTPTTTSEVPPLEATPSAAPSAEGGKKPLAETGAGAPLGMISGAAAVVVVAGAGALYASRRRRA